MIKRLLASVIAGVFLSFSAADAAVIGSIPALQIFQPLGAGGGGGGSGCLPGGTMGDFLYDNGAGGCSDTTALTTDGTNITASSFANSTLKLLGSSTGKTTFTSDNAGASNFTLHVPAANDTIAVLAATQTLTNKTINASNNTLSNIPNAALTNSATTVNGQTCTLGSTCTVTAAASGITIGTTTITSGTDKAIVYDNAGVIGNLAVVNNAVLSTGPTGVPGESTTLPSGLSIPSPTMTTPTLGVASATTINKVTLTAPASGATLTIADGKTLTASNTLTFTGTDGSSVAFGTGGTVLYSGGALGTPSSGVGTNLTSLNASNLSSGTVAAARGGAGTINGALKGNGSGVVSQAACTDLSDCNVGTWTPLLRGTSTAGSNTYVTQVGSYSQIGSTYIASFNIVTSAVSGMVGNLEITGLPGGGPVAGVSPICALTWSGLTLTTLYTFVGGVASAGSTAILLRQDGSAQTDAAIPATAAAAATTINGTCSYKVT